MLMLPAVDFFSVPKVVPTLSGSKAIFILDNPHIGSIAIVTDWAEGEGWILSPDEKTAYSIVFSWRTSSFL